MDQEYGKILGSYDINLDQNVNIREVWETLKGRIFPKKPFHSHVNSPSSSPDKPKTK
jgi:hypothetical protein